ncbi:hypothetical protein AN478_06065 [Thiohalorhabdus denitrificans]|uniref:Roadblock/LAMTOR2 domain-containing protein n=1 Tax=Thiohalorhabdus denitrificans TaxID=381306 RepID=A0A0P9CNM8_9GAMM|nr:hypothetical protein [Thiohalorhabdus denitrificans]KPV40719.1 hypothetical protein AN478_06065 [Thiohalorhabdus denitrificans]SCY46095.1 hypothetical protein SAMN05661077_2164 [Thiohalorhabdus denitrificans]
MASTLNDVVADMLEQVDEALGVAVVDLNSGLLLSVAHNVPYFTQSYLDAVAAAAVDMFRGKTVSNVENLIAQQRGEEPKRHVQEVQMGTTHTHHVMSIVPDKPDALLVLITSKKANLGMAWAAMKNNLPKVAPYCP